MSALEIAEPPRYFVDTNVLLYALDQKAGEKRPLADAWLKQLWSSGSGRLSRQVLNEFYTNAVRKFGVDAQVARFIVRGYEEWKPETLDLVTVERAWHWCDTAGINFWDALIVAAAEHSNCSFLLSEDFQAGRVFGNLSVVNPFDRRRPEETLAESQPCKKP